MKNSIVFRKSNHHYDPQIKIIEKEYKPHNNNNENENGNHANIIFS